MGNSDNPAYKKRSGKNWMFLIYLILAAYLINIAFKFVKIPAFIVSIQDWIILAGGVFLVLGAINSFKLRR
jgi:hypothetical protein